MPSSQSSANLGWRGESAYCESRRDGSVMSGSAFWAIVGNALVIGGVLLLVLERRRR